MFDVMGYEWFSRVPLMSIVFAMTLTGSGPKTHEHGARDVPPPPSLPASLVLDDVTIVDVERGTLRSHQRVVIVGNRIQALGDQRVVPLPASASVVNAQGKYLIPGLWDWHVHTTLMPDVIFPYLLVNGITGIRDAGAIELDTMLQWRREIWAGTRVGPPRQILSSQMLDSPGRNGKCGVGRICIRTAAQARQVVDSFKTIGADMLKMYSLGSKEMYFAVAAEARRAGIPFGGHVAAEGLTLGEASDSGASIIDHLEDANYRAASIRPCIEATATIEQCRALIERFRRNGTWWVPTVGVMANLAAWMKLPPPTPAADTIVTHFRAFQSAFSQSDSVYRYPIDSASIAALRSSPRDSLGWLRFMGRLGAPILVGTDANLIAPFIPVLPGFSIHVELAVAVAEGLTPLEALQAATLNAATYLHATDSMGTVAQGKLADLVLLDADPLRDITNTQRIRAVVANGRYFDRDALDAQIQKAKQSYKTNFDVWVKSLISKIEASTPGDPEVPLIP